MVIHSYKKEGQKLYRFCAYIGTDYKGNQKQVRRSGFRTKKEAERAYNQLRLQANPNEEQYSFNDLVDLWLSNYIHTVKGSTYNKTVQTIKSQLLPVFGDARLSRITTTQVQTFVNDTTAKYRNGHKFASLLKSLFSYAVKMELMAENPFNRIMMPKRKEKKENTNFYTKEELKKFLEVSKKYLAHNWYVFFYLLAHTGMRRGEALALTWDKINRSTGTIRIDSTISLDRDGKPVISTTKTKTGKRVVDVDQETMGLLYSLKEDSDFVFSNSKGSFITLSQPVRQLQKLSKASGIKYISPHGFRHTHCSMLFAAGVSIPQVQARLGHSDVQTTLNIYNHVYHEDKKEALSKFREYLEHD